MDLLIRTAGVDDLDVAVELFTGYLDFYGVTPEPDRVQAFIAERLRTGDSVILLAERGDRALGLAQVFPTLSSLDLAPLWTLGDLVVVPEARGQGVGRALLRAVCERAAAAGAACVALETAHSNTTAQALYESEGFVRDTVYRVYTRALLG